MTIASCYVSPEGVVFGADSTATYAFDNGNHYFNHAQKLFEIGDDSTLGFVTWGLGGLVNQTYRTMLANLADALAAAAPNSVRQVIDQWIDLVWAVYSDPNTIVGHAVADCKALHARPAYDANAANPVQGMRSEQDEKLYQASKTTLVAGFCIGGHVATDRTPRAFYVIFDPLAAKPAPTEMPMDSWLFWGAPNFIQRLLFGADDGLRSAILAAPQWNGSEADLQAIVAKHSISLPQMLPIREAIDFMHACIVATIKAIKFSPFSQICGGPVEIAVVTSDRNFRWVRHKPWDTAITDGDLAP